MDKLEALRAFTRVVERGSFSAVAHELHVKQSTISKWIQALESEVGTQLIERTTRAMHVTEAGRRFHARALAVLDAYDAALGSVHEHEVELRGRIRLCVSDVFGRMHVVPQVARFALEHPAVSLDVVFTDRYVNLVEEGFDLAIRLGQPDDSTMRVQALGSTGRRLVASRGYLERHGRPESPKELADHDCLTHSSALGNTWTFTRRGRTQRVSVRGRVTASNSEATLALCRRGLGVCLLATWLVDPEIRAGRLVELLEDYEAPVAKINALTPPGRYAPARVRAFIESLRKAWKTL